MTVIRWTPFWRQFFFLAKGKGLSLERTLNEALVLLAAFALINAQTDPQSRDSCGNNRSCLQPRFTYVFWRNEMIINLFFGYPESYYIFRLLIPSTLEWHKINYFNLKNFNFSPKVFLILHWMPVGNISFSKKQVVSKKYIFFFNIE